MKRLKHVWHYLSCSGCRTYLDPGFMFVPKEYLYLSNNKHNKKGK